MATLVGRNGNEAVAGSGGVWRQVVGFVLMFSRNPDSVAMKGIPHVIL
jgi:hypothetical protein